MYTIGKLAKDADLPVYTVRFYISQGLLNPVEILQNGYMVFDESSLFKIKEIKQLREEDRRTIKEIKDYFKRRGIL
jgi:DNA-binding transcriptional MerR regulator